MSDKISQIPPVKPESDLRVAVAHSTGGSQNFELLSGDGLSKLATDLEALVQRKCKAALHSSGLETRDAILRITQSFIKKQIFEEVSRHIPIPRSIEVVRRRKKPQRIRPPFHRSLPNVIKHGQIIRFGRVEAEVELERAWEFSVDEVSTVQGLLHQPGSASKLQREWLVTFSSVEPHNRPQPPE